MELPELRPACMMSGEESLAALDALHAQLALLETYRLELLVRLDDTGHAKEIHAHDTARLIAKRHRRNLGAVRRELTFAKALPKYTAVSAALPDPHAPRGNDPLIQYAEAPAASAALPDPHAPRGNDPLIQYAEAPAASAALSDPQAPLGEVEDAEAAAASAALPDPHAPRGNDPLIRYAEAAAASAALPDPHAPRGNDPLLQYAEAPAAEAPELLPVLLHPAQAQAIVAALEAVPSAAMVPVEELVVAEEQMVEAARHLAPWELARLGQQVREVLDTDGLEPAEEAAARREAFWLKNADQGVKFGGYLSNERAALLRTLIEPGTLPRKSLDGEPDPRSREKRQADRFSDVLQSAASAGELPGSGGVKPHITVTMDLADLIQSGKNATGDLLFGDSLSAGAVRRLACDAEIIPIVLGTESQPLDVGRAKRLITPAMRKALNLRDKGCVVCGAPPIYCDAHHIVSWLDGGPTSIDNLALFCRAHHTDVDHGHYTVTITNGTVHVSRPTWADPPPPRHPAGLHHGPNVWDDSDAKPCPDTEAKTPVSSERVDATGKHLRPVRAYPLVNDPPPLIAPPDFAPWGPENLNTG
ncbi:HNH endonuclease [Kribbella monticola]|uniref:HNH endonuclease n=1 Tax=Kribbella monticola TaxID=2185285 RepID=UPI001E2E1BC2|nr:HNH endonuclease signature motif containing protein [Kribbella monticola]